MLSSDSGEKTEADCIIDFKKACDPVRRAGGGGLLCNIPSEFGAPMKPVRLTETYSEVSVDKHLKEYHLLGCYTVWLL
jgi:hypothetical protein